ncbi:MAG: CSLREA domain-containing protein, partial [Verrucomicrobiota bacterium]
MRNLFCLVLPLVTAHAWGAVITVTSLDDDTNTNGEVTLREAILAAETDLSVDGSAAGSGADTIVFDPGLTAAGDPTISLELYESGEAGPSAFVITSPLTIAGASGEQGIRLAGSTNNDFRLFHVRTGAVLRLSWLNLTGGSATGTVGQGGAILNEGTSRLTHCAIYSNRAVTVGGGPARGGAIHNAAGDLGLENSTLSGNTAVGGDALGAAIYSSNGFAGLTNCTIATNVCMATTNGTALGHGMFALAADDFPVYYLFNNIFFDGMGGTHDFYGTHVGVAFLSAVGDGNMVESHSGLFAGVVAGDPGLLALADNGGPTLTHALPPGSPAINAGFFFLPADSTDQRGAYYPRYVDGGRSGIWQVDIGAFEVSELDFGDAPTATNGYTYATLRADSGPAHALRSGLALGRAVDAEADGQPALLADGDDI